MDELVFLKLGGSLITDKSKAYTPLLEVLANISGQIRTALDVNPGLSLLLGHGSGSFGHTAAREHGTRLGVITSRQWLGFSEVWYQASTLNRFVMDTVYQSGVPSLALAPVSAVTTRNGEIIHWDLQPIKMALAARLVPTIYGDVIFDSAIGGTILSTEDLFGYLARDLKPARILLAGLEGAVWADFPNRTQRIEKITPATFDDIKKNVGASNSTDVTGGMESKVRQMLDLVQQVPSLTIQIFSGKGPGNIERALAGENLGTMIAAD